MFDSLKNATIYRNKYKTHSEAMIVSCFFNPQKSPYRLLAFKEFYNSIKHLNHTIVECIIGDDKPQLNESENIKRVYTENLLWHKESLLNKVISELPEKYKYIFWVDADVIFTNQNWLVEGVEVLKTKKILQPFDLCVHLEKDELKPSFDLGGFRFDSRPNNKNNKVWRSFCANYVTTTLWSDNDYNTHGHVGFAWGAQREVLKAVPLYDRALIGGADHIIAHAAAGQLHHSCITKSFTENINEVDEWSKKFNDVVQGSIGYVKGDLYHIWHGDINKRQYLKRIQDFTPTTKSIVTKDKNGLYVTKKGDDKYIRDYFAHREVKTTPTCNHNHDTDDGFLTSMAIGYMTDSTMMGGLLGGNFAGAMIGDMLNNSDEHKHESFGGGDFGGGGAGSDWTPDNTPVEHHQHDSIDVPVDTTNHFNNFDVPVSDSTQTNVPNPDTFS
jgi:hypothetical protein